MELSVVIPTFNEQKNIQILIKRLAKEFKEKSIDAEIIVVDDDSPDKTWEAAKAMKKVYPNLVVQRRIGKKGLASAWVDGCLLAKGDFIGIIDADLCHSPEDLLKVYSKCKKPQFDLVIGSRYLPGSGGMKEKSALAILASKVAQVITRVVLGVKGTDITHSFRVFRKSVFHAIRKKLKSEGNVFLAEFVYWAQKKGYKVGEVPITYGKRIYGETKLSVTKETIRYLYRIFLIRLGR